MLAVGPPGSPIPAGYWTKDNNHCTSGGAPLELW